jgi:hypothetical protein
MSIRTLLCTLLLALIPVYNAAAAYPIRVDITDDDVSVTNGTSSDQDEWYAEVSGATGEIAQSGTTFDHFAESSGNGNVHVCPDYTTYGTGTVTY